MIQGAIVLTLYHLQHFFLYWDSKDPVVCNHQVKSAFTSVYKFKVERVG